MRSFLSSLLMFVIFDRLSKHIQKSKKPRTDRHWFLIVVEWLVKKGLNFGSSSSYHANNFLRDITMTTSIS